MGKEARISIRKTRNATKDTSEEAVQKARITIANLVLKVRKQRELSQNAQREATECKTFQLTVPLEWLARRRHHLVMMA